MYIDASQFLMFQQVKKYDTDIDTWFDKIDLLSNGMEGQPLLVLIELRVPWYRWFTSI